MGLIMPKIINVLMLQWLLHLLLMLATLLAWSLLISGKDGWLKCETNQYAKQSKWTLQIILRTLGPRYWILLSFNKRQRRYFLRTPRYSKTKTIRGDLAKSQDVQVGSVTSANMDIISKSMGIIQMWTGYGAVIWSTQKSIPGACKDKGKISQILWMSVSQIDR